MNSPLEQTISRMPATILLIDDNAVQAATRQTILKRAGYFVIAALNPTRALDQIGAGEFPAEIGLVITDHVMPGMNGVELAIQVKAVAPQCKMLIFSGQEDSQRLIEKARERGYDLTLVLKPIHPTKMVELIRGL